MEKLLQYLIAMAPNPLAKTVLGAVLPTLTKQGVDPRLLQPVLEKVAMVIRGQTPVYTDDNERDLVTGVVELLPHGLQFYGVALTAVQVEPLVAAVSRRLLERFPATV